MKVADTVKRSLVMLSGTEDVLRARALQDIFSHLGIERDDFDLQFLDADASLPQDWIASASTIPFLAERRIVVVRHLLRFDPALAKTVDFKALPETALVILVADSEIINSDERERKLSANRTKWEALVTGAKGAVEKFSVDARAVQQLVKSEFQSSGKKISERAVEVLVEMTGGSMSRSLDEAQKLILYVGKGEEIREADVREVVVASREWNIFKLIDAIQGGAVPEGLRQLRILVGSTPKTDEAAIGRVLPMFNRHFRLLWQARVCLDAQVSPSSAPSEILASFPSKPNLAAESDYRQRAVMASARKASLAQIQRCLAIVSEADGRLKGLEASFSAMDTLDRMVLDLSRTLA